MARTLILAGADVRVRDRRGGTALFYFAGNHRLKDLDTMALLLDRGAEVDAVEDELGMTVFMYAAVHNPDAEVLDFLLGAGADINAKDRNGAAALHLALMNGHKPAVISFLVEKGADVNAPTLRGASPLMYAAERMIDTRVLSRLIKAGADINARDAVGATPLMWAVKAGYLTDDEKERNVLFLLDAGADGTIRDRLGGTAYDMALNIPALRRSPVLKALDKARK
jgi:ankyrin repeat protein